MFFYFMVRFFLNQGDSGGPLVLGEGDEVVGLANWAVL